MNCVRSDFSLSHSPPVPNSFDKTERIAANLKLFESSLAPQVGDIVVADLPQSLDILVLTSRRSPVYEKLDKEHVEVQPTWEEWLVKTSGLDAQSKCVQGGVSVSASPQQYVKFLRAFKASGKKIKRLLIEDHHASIRYLLSNFADVLLAALSDDQDGASVEKISFLTCTSGGMLQEGSPLQTECIKVFDTGNSAVTVTRAMGIKLGTDPYTVIATKLRKEVAEFFAEAGQQSVNVENMANMFLGSDNPVAKASATQATCHHQVGIV